MTKIANCLVIGGPIGVGKSTLVDKLPFIGIQELFKNDPFQKLVLKKMYQGDQLAGQIIQFDMMIVRFNLYKNKANQKQTTVFDRSIFEDVLFAKYWLKDKNSWEFYSSLWNDKVKQLINQLGKPKLYVLLTCSWEIIKKRLFSRGRTSEIDYFKKNEKYFKNLFQDYSKEIIKIFKKYKLNYFVINTNNLTTKEISNFILNELNRQEIKYEIS